MTLHPALVLFATAVLAAVTRGLVRRVTLVAGALAALVAVTQLTPGDVWTYEIASYRLEVLRVDALSHLFGLVFSAITAIGVIYALHVGRTTEHVATLTYAGASLGVVYAGDWLTAFTFWELMGVASLAVIWHGGTRESGAAGFRYLLVHIAGGSLFFVGVALHLAGGGALAVDPITADGSTRSLAYWCILAGVAVNAAIPPVHAWLTDAYPEASVTGTVFLSAYTTKTAVYVLLRGFPGSELLLWAGVMMALYGVVYAVLENDIRRLLGYHIVSQVGYMVAGVGMGTPLALNGSAAHAFCHILYKALLLMGAGAVLQATGRRKLTELGGIAERMPLVVVLYTVGAFSISGVPLFNGFISKSMVVSAAAEGGWPTAELLLTLASIGTFLHTGLKLPYFTFFGSDRGIAVKPIPRNMIAAMALGSAACIALGVAPGWLYARLVWQPVEYHPYTLDHVVSAMQLLVGTGVGFWWLLAKLGGEATISLDTDWLYRKPLPAAMHALVAGAGRTGASLQAAGLDAVRRMTVYAANPFLVVSRAGLEPVVSAVLGTPRLDRREAAHYDENVSRLPIGVTVFWVVVGFSVLALLIW